MNSFKQVSLIVVFFIFSSASFSQIKKETDNLSLNSGTIDSQFEFVIRKSNKYQDYKVVKKNWLYTLKAHTLDSLKAVRKDLVDTRLIVKKQDKEISDLKLNLNNTQSDLDKTNTEKDNMALFGMQMSKTGYNVLMWSIIAGLLALLLFFIYKFKNSNAITKGAKHALAEIEEEFEEHRKTALEREQKVRRQLQDEINKQKGL
ncbi:tRNA (guanine-N1)-methyltransferase [Flavivirga amylovorans]|uniref:tRNA (Guanine-N1)-methyltransferase n=1 Tax=Flavivirga amylovorans TaxID=870486 RepID=A0ABT8X3M5_9FLAO|nr:tRNA (guanine-N1)-methyltransferase [Flavivirga amylovorans]MDO5988563.1 tRNA (guanine-N1)-methyltransferase [Flavivirga amylovorans]